MMISNLARPLRGVISPLITPLKDIDVLDRLGLERLLEHVIRGGVSAIYLLGTSGEGPSLSYRLRIEVIQEACATVRGRVPVLVGITDTAYVESVRVAEVSAKAGAAAVVVAPPCYLLYTQSDLIYYLERLSETVSLPIFLYNFPVLTKIAYAPETIKLASEIPKIIGLKDSSGDLDYLRTALEIVRHRKDFSVFIGPEEKLIDAIRIGAHGGVCGGTNVNPDVLVALYRAASKGLWDQAEILQKQVNKMSKLLYSIGDPESGYLRGIKSAANHLGLCDGILVPPLRPFSERESLEIERGLNLLQLNGIKTSVMQPSSLGEL
jgi:dihydrodipicolinate synthase/N-acetylneuraminate lyase